jgi:hypothetical protein
VASAPSALGYVWCAPPGTSIPITADYASVAAGLGCQTQGLASPSIGAFHTGTGSLTVTSSTLTRAASAAAGGGGGSGGSAGAGNSGGSGANSGGSSAAGAPGATGSTGAAGLLCSRLLELDVHAVTHAGIASSTINEARLGGESQGEKPC